jgi:myo-inositol-1-phosphate synthase
MDNRRVGLWLVGAFGGVGTTVALGLAALGRGLVGESGLVTALPSLRSLPLDAPGRFVVGGHDIRRASFEQTVREFQQRSNIFENRVVEPCLPDLWEWSANVRPGTVLNAGDTISRLADVPEARRPETPRGAIERIKSDLQAFQRDKNLQQVVVISVASTEPPFPTGQVHENVALLHAALERRNDEPVLPASSLYALAALELGHPYVNFTPSLGASFPAAVDLAHDHHTVVAGKDGKTGETLMKSVLAPMFAYRNMQVLSWVGHNIFGNRDGLVLNDPRNKESKVKTKDQVVSQILGYKPQTHVSIEYIQSLDDWKTAWDHIHFQGFLGVKMLMQFIWQGCDSVLAAPLVIDLARLALLSQRRGEVGVLRHLACFFKNPMGVEDQDFFKQFALLEEYASRIQQ